MLCGVLHLYCYAEYFILKFVILRVVMQGDVTLVIIIFTVI